MSILLSKSYGGYNAGNVVQFATSTEQSLAQQGFGTLTAAPVSPGPVTVSSGAQQARVGVPAAAVSVTVTHAGVTTESKIVATIAQATADATAFNVARVVPAAGSFTIFLNAAATAAVLVDWVLTAPIGVTATN